MWPRTRGCNAARGFERAPDALADDVLGGVDRAPSGRAHEVVDVLHRGLGPPRGEHLARGREVASRAAAGRHARAVCPRGAWLEVRRVGGERGPREPDQADRGRRDEHHARGLHGLAQREPAAPRAPAGERVGEPPAGAPSRRGRQSTPLEAHQQRRFASAEISRSGASGSAWPCRWATQAEPIPFVAPEANGVKRWRSRVRGCCRPRRAGSARRACDEGCRGGP